MSTIRTMSLTSPWAGAATDRLTFLKDYKQTLLADAYGGYDGVVVGNDITRAGCWAHARRKFVDAEKSHPQIAAEAVGMIKRLYAVEDHGKGLDVG